MSRQENAEQIERLRELLANGDWREAIEFANKLAVEWGLSRVSQEQAAERGTLRGALELALRDRREALETLTLAQERGTALHNELTALKAAAPKRLAEARKAFLDDIWDRCERRGEADVLDVVAIEGAFDDALSTLQPIPEHIKCIGHPDSPDLRSLCGSDDGVPGFRFEDVHHAIRTVQEGGRLTPCGECLARAIVVSKWGGW